jgi:hypothetical protein
LVWTIIGYNYFDSLHNGLLAGNGLLNDINTLESAYMDQNIREYELSKQLALSQLDPQALLQLKRNGFCTVQIPEAVFDLDHPGQYMRRHKTVNLSILCVPGPYTSVCCTLTLISNKYRNSNGPGSGYSEVIGNDPRFTYNVGYTQAISTSTAQEDNGLFELNFRDERYLPFEGTGCIATWQISLPSQFRQFDYNAITDVILRLRYTARDGGSGLLNAMQAVQEKQLNGMLLYAGQTGLYQGFNMRQQFANELWTLLSTGTVAVTITLQQLPFWCQANTPVVDAVEWFVIPPSGSSQTPTLSVNGTPVNLNQPSPILGNGVLQGSSQAVTIGTPFTLAATNMASLGDVSMLIHYKVTT